MNGTILQYNMETGNESRLYNNNIFNNDLDSETSLNASVNSEPLKTGQYSDVNSFRFNFNIKYNTMVEESLYPKLYQKFNIDGYPVLQRTGYNRTVCLTCQCDLWMQKNFHSVFSHTSGHKHQSKVSNPAVIKNLQSYHEVFLNFEPYFQAHQVFFVPDNDPSCVKCILCMLFVKKHDVFSHILNEPHKTKVMYLRNESNLKNTFYLLDQHLQVYGIQYEMKITPYQKKESKKSKTRVYTTVRKKDIDVKDHEIVKSINNPIDDNPLKTLPRRFEEHLKYLRNDGSKVTCIACKEGGIVIPKNQIKKHLILSSHLDSTKLESFTYLFFCEICDLKFYDEMTWDMHFEKIPEKHKNMAASRRENICEHECLTCKVILYGDALSLRRHKNSNTRRIERSRGSFLGEETKKYFSSKTIINENGQQLLDDVKEVLDSQECIFECCRDLEVALSGYFKDCEAHPFGSRISGLGNSESDLDVFIDIGDMYDGVKKQSEKNQKKIINIAIELFKNKEEFYRITSRPSARTPIIRLKHKPTELDCDISFRHGLSVENTKFLKFCFQLQPISQTLILLIKKWSHLCVLHENITTYAMAMLAIFYLQTDKYLLSVNTVKTLNPTESRVIDGWDTITYTAPIEEVRQHIVTYKGDIVTLLKGFFKYYSDFNYKAHVICPLLGTIVLKSQFTENLTGSLLPQEMKSYINKINKEENPEYFRSLSEFCIQDPFDLSHNLTKACSPTFVEKFKNLCTLTYEMLEKL